MVIHSYNSPGVRLQSRRVPREIHRHGTLTLRYRPTTSVPIFIRREPPPRSD
ncbi:hypothetical protein STRIP9103_00311 [Streptomyces ipomoeae 91-03]|uniref:Uncharacterized protein n=1 Tax=Streptomyces ipomoeae 91-03 TaxID=698759 RepID=L1L3G2_9ACTN|nr:hypothetical protein STRIP9103_00311 [Streptomyces ipomoeae 91-03]